MSKTKDKRDMLRLKTKINKKKIESYKKHLEYKRNKHTKTF